MAGSVTASVRQAADAAVCVEAAWQLRPSEDEALRAADIGASGVSEVPLPTSYSSKNNTIINNNNNKSNVNNNHN